MFPHFSRARAFDFHVGERQAYKAREGLSVHRNRMATGCVGVMPEVLVYQSEVLLRVNGAERVEEEASYALAERLEDHAEDILLRAELLAKRRGGKRLNADDIIVAAETLE